LVTYLSQHISAETLTVSCVIYPFVFHQLEKAKKKEAAFIVGLAKRDLEIADLKVTWFISNVSWEVGIYCCLANFYKADYILIALTL